ncbi:MAG: hypothetical protein WC383_12260 [Gammaproteobacteria bacterium]|jgi:hypothetical protein
MQKVDALFEMGGLEMWLPPRAGDDPAKDTRFLAAVRSRRDALEAYVFRDGPEPDAAWSLDDALKLRVKGDPKEPREIPSVLRTHGVP